MTTPFWCLTFIMFLPVMLAWVGGYHRSKAFGTVDNKLPRAQYAKLEGAGARGFAAQSNAWEALAMFTAAVMMAHFAGAGTGAAAANACLLFVLARILHAVFYLADKDMLRSLSFIVGVGCCIRLIQLAASAG